MTFDGSIPRGLEQTAISKVTRGEAPSVEAFAYCAVRASPQPRHGLRREANTVPMLNSSISTCARIYCRKRSRSTTGGSGHEFSLTQPVDVDLFRLPPSN